jgi:hypothetical protein
MAKRSLVLIDLGSMVCLYLGQSDANCWAIAEYVLAADVSTLGGRVLVGFKYAGALEGFC